MLERQKSTREEIASYEKREPALEEELARLHEKAAELVFEQSQQGVGGLSGGGGARARPSQAAETRTGARN